MTQKCPKNWSELTSHELPVLPVRSFRTPDDTFFLQYLKGGEEFVAIRGAEPYGTLTEAAAEQRKAREFHLLDLVNREEEFTVFHVPRDALSLKAVTLGTSRDRHEELGDTYARTAYAIKDLLRIAPAPAITIEDVIVNRSTGDLLVVPPVAFGTGTNDLEPQAASLTESMRTTLSFWPAHTVDGLAHQIQRGFREAV